MLRPVSLILHFAWFWWGVLVLWGSTNAPPKPSKIWACFNYIGKGTTFITNLFGKTDIKIALRTNNTVQSLLTHKQQTPDKYSQSGVYKLKCHDCNRAYVGQIGSSFKRGLMNTEMHSDLTTTPIILPHISSRKHIHLAPYTTQCRF